MKLEFIKYQGTGNDFIIIDGFKYSGIEARLDRSGIKHLCDRHMGIGADGLMILAPHDTLDFTMIYYNSDGLTSSMCGNGGRCIVHFAHHMGYIGSECSFEAIDGLHTASIDTEVSLKMNNVSSVIDHNGDRELDTGSPHYVTRVDELEIDEFIKEARSIRYSERYKDEGININFLKLMDDHIQVRTYERGVEDETLSCGTGVVASAIVASQMKEDYGQSIRIVTKGGELTVKFSKNGDEYFDIYLIGPAKEVFRGTVSLS